MIIQIYVVSVPPAVGTVDAEIKIPSSGNPELSKIPFPKPKICEKYSSCASLAAMNCAFFLHG